MKFYTPYQFSIFRIVLGVYLLIHFIHLLPYAPEIWSNQGTLPDPSLNFTFGLFPNLLNYFDSPVQTQVFVSILIVAALCFTLGIQRRLSAFVLWVGWACLFNRNNLISNPGIPFVGWLLLCSSVIPSGEPWSLFSSKKENWELPKVLFIGAWVIMACGYTISGIDKLHAPSWVDGSAILHLLNNPLARDWWPREILLQLPDILIKIMTWSILFMELAFLPLSLHPKTRKFAWMGMVAMHLGILMIVDFADLTCGMLMIHLFTIDARWFKASSLVRKEEGIDDASERKTIYS